MKSVGHVSEKFKLFEGHFAARQDARQRKFFYVANSQLQDAEASVAIPLQPGAVINDAWFDANATLFTDGFDALRALGKHDAQLPLELREYPDAVFAPPATERNAVWILPPANAAMTNAASPTAADWLRRVWRHLLSVRGAALADPQTPMPVPLDLRYLAGRGEAHLIQAVQETLEETKAGVSPEYRHQQLPAVLANRLRQGTLHEILWIAVSAGTAALAYDAEEERLGHFAALCAADGERHSPVLFLASDDHHARQVQSHFRRSPSTTAATTTVG